MKNFFIAIQIEENKKYYAYTLKVSSSDNLLSKLQIKNITVANICKTEKEAKSIVESWNEIFKANDNYLF